MKTVVVDGAKARKNNCSMLIGSSGFAGAKKPRQIKFLAFHKDTVESGNIGKAQVPSISREDGNSPSFCDWPGFGLEASIKELVEGFEGFEFSKTATYSES